MARPPERRKGYVLVRLTDVPEPKRLLAAERMIRREGLAGEPALLLYLAATRPRQNPALFVPAEFARRVIG